jgi:YD repeat-containing protein
MEQAFDLLKRIASVEQGDGATTMTYDVDGNLLTITKAVTLATGPVTYRKTFTWVGGNCTAISAWTEV